MEQKNDMALTSMILGIASIVLSCCCYLGMILGSLAIIFAALSRVDEMHRQAKTGLITGIIGMVLSMFAIGILLAIGVLSGGM